MPKITTVLLLLAVGCSSAGGDTTTSSVVTSTTVQITSTSEASTSTTVPRDCPRAPYQLTALPFGIGTAELDADEIEPDVWTSVGGTNTTFFGRQEGDVAIALIRGTLPAVDWPAEKGEVFIDGTRGVAGPHPDGTWVVGWFEEPRERCDLYTMVFYPPVAPSDVESTLEGMVRVAG